LLYLFYLISPRPVKKARSGTVRRGKGVKKRMRKSKIKVSKDARRSDDGYGLTTLST